MESKQLLSLQESSHRRKKKYREMSALAATATRLLPFVRREPMQK